MQSLNEPFKEFVSKGEPLVSFVIPSFNKAPFLSESVTSALKQTYQNIEVVIVNDGSTDNTSEVAREIIKNNPKHYIRLVEKPNGGISDARNSGIALTRGRIVVTLDGDDLVEPTFVELGIKAMRQFGCNLVTCNVQLFGVTNREWEPLAFNDYSLRYDNSIPTLAMYDKDLWVKTGGYKVAFGWVEDWEFWVNCSRYGLKAHQIKKPLFRYRTTEEGLANVYIRDKWRECVSLIMTANSDLYPIEDLQFAATNTANMTDLWLAKLEKLLEKYPKEWLLNYWISLAAEARGDHQRAFECMAKAVSFSKQKEWQPLMRLALLLERSKDPPIGNICSFYKQAMILRVDLSGQVREALESYDDGKDPEFKIVSGKAKSKQQEKLDKSLSLDLKPIDEAKNRT